jgi:hypothetical protein
LLQKVSAMDQKTCEQKYKYQILIINEVLCAKGEENKGTRLMDTGGPLQCLVHGKWLVSHLELKNTSVKPDMYAQVKSYVKWIRNKIKENYKCA